MVLPVSATDPTCQTPQYKVNRWLLGQPNVVATVWDQICINPAYWWWDPSHPDHATNVAQFWTTYTEVAVKYATMAQQLGGDLFGLGSEQDNLFRTRPGQAPYTNDFRTQLTQMVAAVRAVYSGLVTIEQHWHAFAHPEYYGGGAGTAELFSNLFNDLGLDVVAVSAYFPLADSPPSEVLPVSQLETTWESIFQQYLIPLRAANLGKPIIFSEFGYTNDIGAPAIQGSNLGALEPSGVVNGTTPGMEQQQNIFQAFFNVNGRYNDLVQGAFIWGVGILDPQDCTHIMFGIYCKPSAQTVGNIYGQWLLKDINRVFVWAESAFPQYFAPGSTTQFWSGYTYRYYPATGNYLAVKDGRVIVHNGATWNFLDVGPMRTFLDMAGSAGF